MTPHNGKFVAYYRVSTDKQGKSGLGLAAQKSAVQTYLNGGEWQLISTFQEVESGKKNNRPKLQAALRACRIHGAKLIVAKVDRLTRNAAFLNTILESSVEVLFCDLPQIEGPAGKFLLQQMAAVAELEAGFISARTRAALAQTSKPLGGYRPARNDGTPRKPLSTPQNRKKAHEANRAKAADRAACYTDVVEDIRASGMTTLYGIAKELERRGIVTPGGSTRWSATQVQRLLEKL
jgi:DNA invertase Pin-like site-specific DNA recombinase